MRVLLCAQSVLSGPTGRRRAKAVASLGGFIQSRFIRRDDARTVAGQCSFLSGGLWGRVGHVALKCLWEFTSDKANPKVRDCQAIALQVLSKLMEKCRPRSLEAGGPKPRLRAVAWIDGSWRPTQRSGGSGIVLVLLNERNEITGRWVVSCPVPMTLVARWEAMANPRHLIAQIETTAACVLLATFSNKLRDLSLVVFEDHKGAHSTLLRGVAKGVMCAELALSFWWLAMCNDVHVWVDRVDSASNCADDPSKMSLELPYRLGCKLRQAVWPFWLMKGPTFLLKGMDIVFANLPDTDMQESDESD